MLAAIYLFVRLFAGPIGIVEPAADPKATADDVLAMMAKLPVVEVPKTPEQNRLGHWERIGVARELAAAIAEVAPTRTAASLHVVYAAFEGGNQRCAAGDGGKSLGPYQLQRLPESVACDPLAAARIWQERANYSWKRCTKNPPEERLAQLASGSCDNGRTLTRRRAKIAARIAEVELPQE
jgi:hypothetical protein